MFNPLTSFLYENFRFFSFSTTIYAKIKEITRRFEEKVKENKRFSINLRRRKRRKERFKDHKCIV